VECFVRNLVYVASDQYDVIGGKRDSDSNTRIHCRYPQ
jgi:hypothetical protein